MHRDQPYRAKLTGSGKKTEIIKGKLTGQKEWEEQIKRVGK